MPHNHPFYGSEIVRDQQQLYIQSLLSQFKGVKADEALKEQIWNLLQHEKSMGSITIPFKVVLRSFPHSSRLPYIEIILDTKV